jgi:hypothetical protein
MHTLEQLRAGALTGVQRLQMRGGLTEFPREIFDLADSLEILDLSSNALSLLPDDLPRLHKMRIIFCSENQFTELPAVLGACPALTMVGFKANQIRTVEPASLPPSLRWLVLTDNQIEELPDELGRRPAMQKLMLAGNRLRALPASMAQLHRLELLRISANQLTELPEWVTSLPRLAWLACAGNPFCAPQELAMTGTPSAAIGWEQLALKQKLGEGASGVIHRADYRHDGVTEDVAVKLFKGAMTSDGSPLCEMAACIGAGAHPNLIPVLGHVERHPDDTHGLVMALIDPAFINLAGPPSLDSCTRDIYVADKRFDLAVALEIAHGVASAAAQLHQRGIMHGDLYAHNILHSGNGSSLLGDFGGASFYDPASAQAIALQQLEVRAFGCLLEELSERCDAPSSSSAQSALARLRSLRDACLHPDSAQRPLFADIASQLRALKQD